MTLDDDALDLANRRKRLRFRAWHRGIKEADLMLGRFVDAHVHRFGHAECRWFERLFEQPDQDVVDWITGKRPVPDPFDTPLMAAMQKLDYLTDRP